MDKKSFELFVERNDIKLYLDLAEKDVVNLIATAYDKEQLGVLKEVCANNEAVAVKLQAWLNE